MMGIGAQHRAGAGRFRTLLGMGWMLLVLIAGVPSESGAAAVERVPAGDAPAARVQDPLIHDYFVRSVALAFQERHEACMALLDEFARHRPDHPAPYFLKAATYQNWMNTYRTDRFSTAMEANVAAAIARGNKLLETDQDPWLHLFVGASYGFRALNQFRRQQWFRSYFSMVEAIDHLETALEKQPRLYDAYMGIGAYNYWRSARSGLIRSIAFWMRDRREVGVQQMRFVVDHGVYSAPETSYNLLAALIDHGRLEEALALAEANVRRKGAATSVDMYYRGRLLTDLGRWSEAEPELRALVAHLERSDLAAVGYKVESQYRLALCLARLERYDEARRWAARALALSHQRNPAEEHESGFESFEVVLAGLHDLQADLDEHCPATLAAKNADCPPR